MGGCLSQTKTATTTTRGDQEDVADRARENELLTAQMKRAVASSDVHEVLGVETDQFGRRVLTFAGGQTFWMTQVVQCDLWTTVRWESREAKHKMMECLDSACGGKVFDLALEFRGSEFVMACIDAPTGTFGRKWSVAAEYAKSKGGVHWLARHTAPCIRRLFELVPPCDTDDDGSSGYMHTLVDERTLKVHVPRQPVYPPIDEMPSIDVFRAYLHHSHRDGTGISVTCVDDHGKTPAERMREYKRPRTGDGEKNPTVKKADDAAAEEDKTIADMLTEHEESVRQYPVMLSTLLGGTAKCLLPDVIRLAVAYLIPPASLPIQPREFGPKTLAAVARRQGTAAVTAPTCAPR